MLLFVRQLDMIPVQEFPKKEWEEDPTERWMQLCNQLQEEKFTAPTLKIVNPERKWEMVSAYQKCVRRGLTERALWLVGGFLSFPQKEWKYFWRRICTTAAEDVGYGDPELMNFVIACSKQFGSLTSAADLWHLWAFLTTQMCQTQKSRIYCQLSIMEGMIRKGLVPPVTVEEATLITNIAIPIAVTKKQQWYQKNNWRGEGMLHFQHFKFSSHVGEEKEQQPQAFQLLHGLPDFCYDMHTRVGKVTCIRLTGYKPIREFLASHPLREGEGKNDVVGWALFMAEGGLIQDGLVDDDLDVLEDKFVANKFGWSLEDWIQFVAIVREAVECGKVNDSRSKTLDQQKY